MAKKPSYTPTSKAVVPTPGRTFGSLKSVGQKQQPKSAPRSKTT